MIKIESNEKSIVQQKTRCRAIIVEQDFDFSSAIAPITHAVFPALHTVIKEEHFTGSFMSTIIVPLIEQEQVSYLLLVGMGKPDKGKKHHSLENYRRSIGKVVRMAEHHRLASVAIQLPSSSLFGVTDEYLAQQSAEIAKMAMYSFDKYITDPERKRRVSEVTFVSNGHDKKLVAAGIELGKEVGYAVNLARHWIDLPPISLTPQEMVLLAHDIAKENALKITVFNEEQINKMGMGGLAAVGRGSERDCQFIILEYSCGKKDAPTLGFVGKGITFDSGGLSIKQAESMETMKDDMAGAAAVLASMQILSKLKPSVNIIGFMPISENLPSGKAIKPGDIVTFYNGKTAEIKNTDAEGRLILADALSYAEKHYKMDAMIDLATLTGSCAAALGPHFSGLMSQDDKLATILMHASDLSGDALWRLPLPDDYRIAIKSPVADLANIGSKRYMAGAITAGLFLSNFVEKTPWAHLDIAGSAFSVPDISYYRADSATGVGVRLLVQLALNWK